MLEPAETVLAWYEDCKTIRRANELQWRLNAAYCDPRQYVLWTRAGVPQQDQKMTDDNIARFVYDNTGIRSLPKYKSILHRMLTPEGQLYHNLEAMDPSLNRRQAVKLFFEDLRDMLFKYRYDTHANFHQAQSETYGALGLYGTGSKVLLWRDKTPAFPDGFSYKAWPLVDIFIIVDDEGRVYGAIRRMFLNVRMFKRKFPGQPYPEALISESKSATPSERTFAEIIHCVYARDASDYDANALDVRRYPWRAGYVDVMGKRYIGDEEGFLTNPYMTPRAETSAGNPYGYAPAELAFPALGGLSAMKKLVIKQAQKSVDPPILAHDEGALSGRVDIRSAKVNYGALSKEGKPLLQPFVSGANFNVAEKVIEGERIDVEDSFLVSIFRILEKNERMTTAEVYEKMALQGAQIAPSMGRLQAEDQGPQIEREISILVEKGLITTGATASRAAIRIPPELIEAQGQYKVRYTSPLARSMYAEEISGFTRLLEMAMNYAAQTGDKRPLYRLNFDAALPEIADKTNVRPQWINDDNAVAQLEAKDQAAAQQANLLKAAPAAASVITTAMKQDQAVGHA